MELVNKEDIMNIIRRNNDWYGGYDERVHDITEKVIALRPVEERKKGRWEFVAYGDGLGNYHCSECRAIASSYLVRNFVNRHWEYKLTKYCGGCGVKMEGADE